MKNCRIVRNLLLKRSCTTDREEKEKRKSEKEKEREKENCVNKAMRTIDAQSGYQILLYRNLSGLFSADLSQFLLKQLEMLEDST